LLAFVTNDAHFGHSNSFVDANGRQAPIVWTLTATAKACSYCSTSLVKSGVPSLESGVKCLDSLTPDSRLGTVVCKSTRFNESTRLL
jgi:hypothetical protein